MQEKILLARHQTLCSSPSRQSMAVEKIDRSPKLKINIKELKPFHIDKTLTIFSTYN